jgi:hypothetical protein
MPDWSCFQPGGSRGADLVESIVMQAYVQLPLLPRRPDGCWVAPLARIGDRDIRLVESVPASRGQAALRVEMFNRATQSVVLSRECEEVEDAIVAFSQMLPSVRG